MVEEVRNSIIDKNTTVNNYPDTSGSQNIPKWISRRYINPIKKFIERKNNEIEDFIYMLDIHNRIHIHGMGGIGKTEFARKICSVIEEKYEHIAWISYAENLKSSLMNDITLYKEKTEKDRYDSICEYLFSLGKESIIFIDNIDIKINNDASLDLLRRLACNVVITTRNPIFFDSYEPYAIGFMCESKCEELFLTHYTLENSDSLSKIIVLSGRHTLAIEIIAKRAEKRDQTLDDILFELDKYKFKLSLPILTNWNEGAENKMMEQLNKLYKISQIDEHPEYIYVLKNFAILPYLPLPREKTYYFLDASSEEVIEEAIQELSDMSWLERTNEGFTMHHVVREIVKSNLKIKMDDCKKMTEKFFKETKYDGQPDEYERMITYLPFLESIVSFFGEENNLLAAKLYHNLSWIYYTIGYANKASILEKKSLEIVKQLKQTDEARNALAISYNTMGIYQRKWGNLKEAENNSKEAIKIWKDLYLDSPVDEYKHNLSAGYTNLSRVYRDNSDLRKALYYQLRSMRIKKELYKDDQFNNNLSLSYNNLAQIYCEMGELGRAVRWQKKDLDIQEYLHEEKPHPEFAITCCNYAKVMKNISDRCYEEALLWEKKYGKSEKKLLDENSDRNLKELCLNMSHCGMEGLDKIGKRKKEFQSEFTNLGSDYGEKMKYLSDICLEEALKWQKRGVEKEEYLMHHSNNVEQLKEEYLNLSNMYERKGDMDKSQFYRGRAIDINHERKELTGKTDEE